LKNNEIDTPMKSTNLIANFNSSLMSKEGLSLVQFYNKNKATLLNYGCQFTNDLASVEDCLQDLFERINIQFDPLKHTIFYVMASLKRMIIKRKRIKLRQEESLSLNPVAMGIPDNNVEITICKTETEANQKERIKLAFLQLPKRNREAAYLFYYQNHSYQQIADEMKLTKKSTYKLIYNSLEKMK